MKAEIVKDVSAPRISVELGSGSPVNHWPTGTTPDHRDQQCISVVSKLGEQRERPRFIDPDRHPSLSLYLTLFPSFFLSFSLSVSPPFTLYLPLSLSLFFLSLAPLPSPLYPSSHRRQWRPRLLMRSYPLSRWTIVFTVSLRAFALPSLKNAMRVGRIDSYELILSWISDNNHGSRLRIALHGIWSTSISHLY